MNNTFQVHMCRQMDELCCYDSLAHPFIVLMCALAKYLSCFFNSHVYCFAIAL